MKKISPIIIALISFFTLYSFNSFSWDGIDLENNSTIDISSGNLVREGNIIDFFDTDSGNIHTGMVKSFVSVSNGVELIIEDYNTNSERTFLMQED
jgi:hypothetical protein